MADKLAIKLIITLSWGVQKCYIFRLFWWFFRGYSCEHPAQEEIKPFAKWGRKRKNSAIKYLKGSHSPNATLVEANTAYRDIWSGIIKVLVWLPYLKGLRRIIWRGFVTRDSWVFTDKDKISVKTSFPETNLNQLMHCLTGLISKYLGNS